SAGPKGALALPGLLRVDVAHGDGRERRGALARRRDLAVDHLADVLLGQAVVAAAAQMLGVEPREWIGPVQPVRMRRGRAAAEVVLRRRPEARMALHVV